RAARTVPRGRGPRRRDGAPCRLADSRSSEATRRNYSGQHPQYVAIVDSVHISPMCEALRTGELGCAALDVFRKEPLPAESPLSDMPNVLVTPHSMSTAYTENAWLTDLFCENLRRYLDGQ